jgi:hypothetical protein
MRSHYRAELEIWFADLGRGFCEKIDCGRASKQYRNDRVPSEKSGNRSVYGKAITRTDSDLEIVLKRLNPFAFLTGFDAGALACPFIPFLPASTGRPLLSAAIFYSMQLSERSRPALRFA